MIITVGFKTTEASWCAIENAVEDIVDYEERADKRAELTVFFEKWISNDELVNIDFDTVKETVTVRKDA